MHDGLSTYSQYTGCQHSLCNAHILRELNYVIETSKASWATEMKRLLLDIKAAVAKAVEAGKKRLAFCTEAIKSKRKEGVKIVEKLIYNSAC